MLFKMEKEGARKKAMLVLFGAGTRLTEAEQEQVQVEDYNCNNLKQIGSQRLVMVNNAQIYAAETVLFPNQIRPELRHPNRAVTLRCREGKVYLYTEGEQFDKIHAKIPRGKDADFTVFHEIIIEPGQQLEIPADTRYWMQGSLEAGAVILELSGPYNPAQDIFTSSAYSKRS